MKITLKNITLRDDVMGDIQNGNVDTNKYVEYIRSNLDNANFLIKAKLQSLEDKELYEVLSKVFNIELEDKDLLSILKAKYGKHYTGYKTLSTSMIDEEGNNIVLVGASTKNVPDTNEILPLAILRKLVNSYDFVVVETVRMKLQQKILAPDKFEDYQFDRISLGISEQDELFEYKTALLGKEVKNNTVLKRILRLVEQFTKELVYQAKSIPKIGEQDETLQEVGRQYKKAYEANFNKKSVFVNGNHKKSH